METRNGKLSLSHHSVSKQRADRGKIKEPVITKIIHKTEHRQLYHREKSIVEVGGNYFSKPHCTCYIVYTAVYNLIWCLYNLSVSEGH